MPARYELAEAPQFGSVKAAVLAESGKTAEHGIEAAVDAEQLSINTRFQSPNVT